jgi:hypothetical protein
MDDVKINILKYFLKTNKLYWSDIDGVLHKVVSITERIDPADNVKEPSECANFQDGHYVALYNCSLDEFMLATKLQFN